MKKLHVIMIALGLGLFSTLNAGAQNNKPGTENVGPGETKQEEIVARAERNTKELTPHLGLNGEQAHKLRETLQKHYTIINGKGGIYSKPNSPERTKKINEEGERFKAELKSFLSKEQYEKFNNWKEPK